MADVRVTCINKPNRMSSHEHITHLGGATWKWTREEVIRSIDARVNTFYVIDPGTAVTTRVSIDTSMAWLSLYRCGMKCPRDVLGARCSMVVVETRGGTDAR